MKANNYKGRPLQYVKRDEILIVWLKDDPYSGFEVKRRPEGDIYAYGFNGDFLICEIAKAKKIFLEYEKL
jgi:hypothetical protein